MKIPAARADAFSGSPPADVRAILYYGPDSGMVRERALNSARAVATDLSDPFSVVEFGAEALRDDPARLADEAAAMSLAGGRRLVRLRNADDGAAAAVENALSLSWDALVIVEAGQLGPRSKLRLLFEKAGDAAAVGCYLDEGADLAQLIRQSIEKAGFAADRDAIDWIAANLGSDRMVTRSELEKLALYASGKTEISIEDARAIIGDSAAVTVDDVIEASVGGDIGALAVAYARARYEGVEPVRIIRAGFRRLSRLEVAAAAVARGSSPEQAMKNLRPPVFFKQQQAFAGQLRRWRSDLLARGRAELIRAEIECKSTDLPADAICERALMRLAAMAGARVPR